MHLGIISFSWNCYYLSFVSIPTYMYLPRYQLAHQPNNYNLYITPGRICITEYMYDSCFFFQPVHWAPTEISVCPSVDTVWETARVTRKTARVRRDAGTAT